MYKWGVPQVCRKAIYFLFCWSYFSVLPDWNWASALLLESVIGLNMGNREEKNPTFIHC